MIYLDPDLDYQAPRGRRAVRRGDLAPKTSRTKLTAKLTAKLGSVAAPRRTSPDTRVPSMRTFARYLKVAQAAVRLRGRVTILLTTDKAVRRLNRQFRGIDKATDVLSFPADAFIQKREQIAGDLAISVPTARRQGRACGHSVGTELKVLILHGLLHLAGYDHETDNGQMARRERRLRAQLGLPQGLIERAETQPRRERLDRITRSKI